MRGFLSHALGPLSTIESTLIQFKNPAKDIKTLNFNDEWVFLIFKNSYTITAQRNIAENCF